MDVQEKKEVREFLEKELSPDGETIERTASVNWDGKNFLIRIPKEVAWASGLREENVFEKEIKFKIIIDKSGKTKEQSFFIIYRDRPKRKVKNKNAKKTTNKK